MTKVAELNLMSGRDVTYTLEEVTTPLVITDQRGNVKFNVEVGDTISDDITYVLTISIQNGDIIAFGGIPSSGGSGVLTYIDTTGEINYVSLPVTDRVELYTRNTETAPPEITINYTNTDEPIIT
jgi:hypothetical protein|nr:MAG TPA: hypothetical protein [Caudoviricetes sp.]